MEARIILWKRIATEIAKKYDQKGYEPNRESDVFQGSYFVYEIMKQMADADKVRRVFQPHREDMGPIALQVLDDIVKRGITEYEMSSH